VFAMGACREPAARGVMLPHGKNNSGNTLAPAWRGCRRRQWKKSFRNF